MSRIYELPLQFTIFSMLKHILGLFSREIGSIINVGKVISTTPEYTVVVQTAVLLILFCQAVNSEVL